MTSDFQAKARAVLPAPLLDLLAVAGEVAQQAGHRLLLVGGVVRDVSLGRATEDIDLVVVGRGAPLVERLAAALDAAVESESRFRTWRLALPDGRRLDLADARSESYAAPGALPTVADGDLAQDLARRDFSINAMAVELGQAWSEPIDPCGGARDLESGRLRILHPGSFEDDPTRILRGLELAQRLGFELERTTRSAARRALEGGCLDTLSPARFRIAWRRAFGRLIGRGEEALLSGLEMASDLGLLAALGAEFGGELKARARRLVRSMESEAQGQVVVERSRLLFRALAQGDSAAARRLAALWSSRQEAVTEWEAFGSKVQALRLGADGLKLPSQVAAALEGWDAEELELLALFDEDDLDRLLAIYRQQVVTTRLTISGGDLTARGFAAGPEIGAALAATREARMDGLISPGEELEYACGRLRAATE